MVTVTRSFHRSVFIVESPSKQDLAENRQEGHALKSALDLGGVPCRYCLVKEKNAFVESIADLPRQPEREYLLPYLHISAHGNESGIAVTDGSFVSWTELADIIDKRFNDELGYIESRTGLQGVVALNLSCCRGSFACTILRGQTPRPVFSVIASDQDVEWSDGLTAWITFYHLTLKKDRDVDDAIDAMNVAAGRQRLFKRYR